MTKLEFLRRLATLLRGMDPDERAQWLADYSEIIDDYIEEGRTETEAVGIIGSVEAIARQIRTDAGLPADAAETERKLRRTVLILACTAPLWFPAVLVTAALVLVLLFAVLAVILGVLVVAVALLVALASVVLGLYAVTAGLALSSVGFVLGGTVMTCSGHILPGLFTFGAGLLTAGLVLPLAVGTHWIRKGLYHMCLRCFRFVFRSIRTIYQRSSQNLRTAFQRMMHRKECAE